MLSSRCLVVVFALCFAFFPLVKSETNASRMRRGLPPMPPKRMFDPSRVRRDPVVSATPVTPPAPAPTPCSMIGKMDMAIEFRTSSDTLVGYFGKGSGSGPNYNKLNSDLSKATLFNVGVDSTSSRYSGITIPTLGLGHSWCATVNQYSSSSAAKTSGDINHKDTTYSVYSDEPQNYLYNVDCSYSSGSTTQRRNYNWDSNGRIGLEWLQPISVQPDEAFPVPWANPDNKLVRWYPDGVGPTYPTSWPGVAGYIRWSCTP
ncbi:hypothetical protein DFH09DRAFT_19272 [Mycena vulgaris]|nr:hypothetical protein DFH09DRAFT_19272 [Mycena vulgaris]